MDVLNQPSATLQNFYRENPLPNFIWELGHESECQNTHMELWKIVLNEVLTEIIVLLLLPK